MSDFNGDTIDHVLRIHSGLESLEYKLNYRKRDLTPDELYAVGALHCNGVTFSDYGGNENFIKDSLVKVYEFIKKILEDIIDGITKLFGGSVNGGKGAPAKGKSLPNNPEKINLPTVSKKEAETSHAKNDKSFKPEEADLFSRVNMYDVSAALMLAWEDNNPKKEAIKKKIFDLEKVVEASIEMTKLLMSKYKGNEGPLPIFLESSNRLKFVINAFKSSDDYKQAYGVMGHGAEFVCTIEKITREFKGELKSRKGLLGDSSNTNNPEFYKNYREKQNDSIKAFKVYRQIIPIIADVKEILGAIYIEHMNKILKKKEK